MIKTCFGCKDVGADRLEKQIKEKKTLCVQEQQVQMALMLLLSCEAQ